MELSKLEESALRALAHYGQAGLSSILPKVEGLESKAQLKSVLEGLEKRSLVKFQANGIWRIYEEVKQRVLAGELVSRPATPASAPELEREREQRADAVNERQPCLQPAPPRDCRAFEQPAEAPAITAPESPVPVTAPKPERPLTISVSPLQALAESLPEGVELVLSKAEVLVCWHSLEMLTSVPELDTTLGAIRTLQQQAAAAACN